MQCYRYYGESRVHPILGGMKHAHCIAGRRFAGRPLGHYGAWRVYHVPPARHPRYDLRRQLCPRRLRLRRAHRQ